jgi:hypothetical protein
MKSRNNSGPSTLPWGTPDWTGTEVDVAQMPSPAHLKQEKYNYNIHGHILEEAATSKYLGINLNRTLSWNNHINTVAKKASNISAFLQRNLHVCPLSHAQYDTSL